MVCSRLPCCVFWICTFTKCKTVELGDQLHGVPNTPHLEGKSQGKVKKNGKKSCYFFPNIFYSIFSFEIGSNIYLMDFTHGPNEKNQFLVFLILFQNGHIQAAPTDGRQVQNTSWQGNLFDWVELLSRSLSDCQALTINVMIQVP